jgi:hypothetical protein
VERAQIILGCAAGQRVKDLARQCHTRPNTVIKWRERYAQQGLNRVDAVEKRHRLGSDWD